MTQEWDDILSEPMAQLQPDLPAAEGGWRAVRSIEEVSPRPQQPPRTLPDAYEMLSVRLPVQPEESTPASAPPPASLTDQLSLTWANRRRGRRPAAPEADADNWPVWEPAQPSNADTSPVLAPATTLSWRPLRSLLRLFRREGAASAEEGPAPAGPSHPETAPQVGRTAAPAISVESLPAGQAPRSSVDEPSEAPLVHAHRSEHVLAPPSLEGAPPLESPIAVPSTTPVVQTAVEPASPKPHENTLRRWLQRRRAPETMPEEPGAIEAPPTLTRAFQHVPLVDRHAHVVEPNSEPQAETLASPADVPQAAYPEEGEPLPPVLRDRMEKLLDVPLHQVRVFRNSVAHEATHAHRADGLAVGAEVHLAPGRGDPSTPSGQALLAHELSHVAARIAGRGEPAYMEERRAQAIEHSVESHPDFVAAHRQAAAMPASLEHRAQARTAPPTPAISAISPSYSGGGFLGGGVAGPSSSASAAVPAGVHLAPVGRIPAVADSAMGGGGAGSMARPDTTSGIAEADEPAQDETGGVDRVVEAVMRRLRREGSLERERRGAFRSEIGG